MIPLFILKIGGSCLTYKREHIQKVRKDFLPRLCDEIKISRAKKPFSLIIIHGGGSITHPLLDRYQIAQQCETGIISTITEKISAAKIHLAMNLLNKEVTKAFLDKGIPAWPLQTSAIFTSSNRKIKTVSTKPIILALEEGYVPILHGDFILDKGKDIAICSGDLVGCLLAQKLRAAQLLFASDVNGIYSQDPQTAKKGLFFSRMTQNDIPLKAHDGKNFDHSGGMIAKTEYISQYCHNVRVVIFNGLIKNNFKSALLGERVGTEITL